MRGLSPWIMDKAWKMLADKDILSLLGDSEGIDDDVMRLIIVELLSRIKKLEQINFALQALLIQENLLDSETLHQTIKNSKEYLDFKDAEKSRLGNALRTTGIPFREWVNFTLRGCFEKASNSLENESKDPLKNG